MDTLLFLWHFFCGFLLILLSLSRLCWTVCLHVSTIYPFLTLPDTVASWEVCMLVFPLSCVSPCPIPPDVQCRYPEVHYRQWICRDFLLLCFCLFFFLIAKFHFYPPNPHLPVAKFHTLPLRFTLSFHPELSLSLGGSLLFENIYAKTDIY